MDTLAELVAEFEAYLADESQWSSKRMKEYRERFHDHGCWEKWPLHLLAAAKKQLWQSRR